MIHFSFVILMAVPAADGGLDNIPSRSAPVAR